MFLETKEQSTLLTKYQLVKKMIIKIKHQAAFYLQNGGNNIENHSREDKVNGTATTIDNPVQTTCFSTGTKEQTK